MRAILAFLVNRDLVVNLISIFILVLGLIAAIAINREAFPNVSLDIIQIDTSYPGASPEEVEQLIVTPIEQELRSLSGIDKMVSMSFPSSGRITLEVDPDHENRDKIANDVTLAINRARLPADLPYDPVVTEVDGSVFPVMRLAVSAPVRDLELKRLGDQLKDDLLNVKGVAQVVILGDRKAEIRIVADPERMRRERISVQDITRTVQGWNLNVPGGDIDTPEGQKTVRILGEFDNAEDAAKLVLRSNYQGNVLRLGDVARVTETLERPQTLYGAGGQQGFSIMVLKKSDADIINTVDAVRAFLDSAPERYGAEVSIKPFQDFSRFTRMRLGVLTNNGMVGLILVFISLLLFLRFSVAMTTTWGLPIIFAAGLFILYSSGVTLNMISMMGFIMVLGMVVDDAIIIGENITWHMEQGMAPRPAAVQGALELMGPVTTTIMTTVAAFLPLMFMTGIIGKFIIAIPIVVITLLVLSWLESFLVLPSHVAWVTHAGKHPPERAWLQALDRTYTRILSLAIRRRWSTVILSFGGLVAAFVLAGKLSFQLFPPAGVEEFIVRVTAPPGTSLQDMYRHLQNVDREIRANAHPDNLEETILKAGDISVDLGDPLTQRGSRYGQLRAIYTPAVSRPDHDALVEMHTLAGIVPENFPELIISFTEMRPGPPLGRALEAEISSRDVEISEGAARSLMAWLETVPGVTSIDSGLKAGDDELQIRLDRTLATYAGINLATAAQQIRAASGGLVVSTVRRGSEEIDVTIRFPDKGDKAAAQLRKLLIPNSSGGLVPLHKIATLENRPGLTTVRHKDGIRIVNVVADVDGEQVTSLELNRLVRENIETWAGELASEIDVQYGGEEEKNKESVMNLAITGGVALVAIFFILAIQFNNLIYPLVVMLAIPFGAIGIIAAFYLHDIFWKPMPLSFMSMLGMVAMTGVVVNSSLVLLVFIQRARQAGIEVHEAIIEAGRRRLRAVLLTATTTVVGLLPTAYGWGGMDPFVSPMALALSWGLMFATLVTLITIPAVLAAGYDIAHAIRPRRNQ